MPRCLDAYAAVVYVAICLSLKTLYIEGRIQDQYIGCYQDITSQSSWTVAITDTDIMSIELCIVTCNLQSTTFAILQNGRNCLCGDVLDVSSPNYICNTSCSDNDRQVCGGPSGTVSPYVVYTVCPVGFYGSACDKECHCKQHIPCDFVSGTCPNGCDSNWTLSSCSRETSTSVSDRYIGCYGDNQSARTLPFRRDFPSTFTIQICSAFCASNNYTYAGAENHRECYCGDVYKTYGELSSSSCSWHCDGDASQICGAWFNLSVYSACHIGYFGSGCMSRCNCKNEQSCTCANCTCSSGCKSGWMGSRCEFRNCLENNGDCSENETCVTEGLKFASSTRCACKQGYQKTRLWDTCTAVGIDKCSLAECDPSTTTCINTYGDFICYCEPGYERLSETSCKVILSDACYSTGHQTANVSGSHMQVYSVGDVIGAAIGSAAGSVLIFATILIIVILCRRRGLQKEPSQSEAVGTKIQHVDETDATSVNQTPRLIYESLRETQYVDNRAYTELDRYINQ